MTPTSSTQEILNEVKNELRSNENANNDAAQIDAMNNTQISTISTPEEALLAAQQLEQVRPQREAVNTQCKSLEESLKNYVAENRAQLLQNGAKSYTFPGTNVKVVLSETTSTELEHPELLTSQYEQAFIEANPANAGAFSHKLDHAKLQNDDLTNALKQRLGMHTVTHQKWSLTYSKAKKVAQ